MHVFMRLLILCKYVSGNCLICVYVILSSPGAVVFVVFISCKISAGVIGFVIGLSSSCGCSKSGLKRFALLSTQSSISALNALSKLSSLCVWCILPCVSANRSAVSFGFAVCAPSALVKLFADFLAVLFDSSCSFLICCQNTFASLGSRSVVARTSLSSLSDLMAFRTALVCWLNIVLSSGMFGCFLISRSV